MPWKIAASSEHGSVQAWFDLHGHQLLQEQLASVGNLNLANVFSRITPSAVILELEEVCLAEKTTPVADVHSIAVRDVK